MNISTIILKPVMTEKSLAKPGRYTFLVDRRAAKGQIKAAVEAQFPVSVMKVNTLIHKSEAKKLRGRSKSSNTRLSKKAIVTLAKDQRIEELEYESKNS